jgi:hypothetical protein
MKGRGLTSLFTLALGMSAGAIELRELKVLHVGNNAERAGAFESFLTKHVKSVETVSRKDFIPARAATFDVVLLDWQQNEPGAEKFPPSKSPLGGREKWAKPTVFLGSAGLNMAVVWKLKGGSG